MAALASTPLPAKKHRWKGCPCIGLCATLVAVCVRVCVMEGAEEDVAAAEVLTEAAAAHAEGDELQFAAGREGMRFVSCHPHTGDSATRAGGTVLSQSTCVLHGLTRGPCLDSSTGPPRTHTCTVSVHTSLHTQTRSRRDECP